MVLCFLRGSEVGLNRSFLLIYNARPGLLTWCLVKLIRSRRAALLPQTLWNQRNFCRLIGPTWVTMSRQTRDRKNPTLYVNTASPLPRGEECLSSINRTTNASWAKRNSDVINYSRVCYQENNKTAYCKWMWVLTLSARHTMAFSHRKQIIDRTCLEICPQRQH